MNYTLFKIRTVLGGQIMHMSMVSVQALALHPNSIDNNMYT